MTEPIRVRAATLGAAFVGAALAVSRIAFEPESIDEREVREVRAHGPTPAALFARWIDECRYVHEVEGFAWRRIDLAVFDAEPRPGAEPMRLHAFLHGEEVGEASGPPLPSIAPDGVTIGEAGGEWVLSIAL